jgi:hypothetical protein
MLTLTPCEASQLSLIAIIIPQQIEELWVEEGAA